MSLIKVVLLERINCLFVTAPPFSALVPVAFVGKIFGLPVVADFRDDWHFSRLHLENASRSAFAIRVDRILERYVVLKCSAFTAATASYVRNIFDRNPSTARNKAHVITNGFDPDDFKDFPIEEEKNDPGSRVTFVYSGTVWKATSLGPFVKAVEILLKKDPKLGMKISVKILGRVVEQEMAPLKENGLEEIFDLEGYVTHSRSVGAMSTADILLLTLSDLPGSAQIIPGKTFEYMATGKHILAIVPAGETSGLLRKKYGNATVTHPKDVDDISNQILALVKNKETIRKAQEIDVSQYERRSLTKRLATVFSDLVVSDPNGLARQMSSRRQ